MDVHRSGRGNGRMSVIAFSTPFVSMCNHRDRLRLFVSNLHHAMSSKLFARTKSPLIRCFCDLFVASAPRNSFVAMISVDAGTIEALEPLVGALRW